MKRTAPFSKAAIRNACIAGAFAVLPVGAIAIGAISNANTLATCNSGETARCYQVVDSQQSQITNQKYLSDRKRYADEKAAKAALAAKRQEELQAVKAKAAQEAADKKAAAEAKFKAEGWWEVRNGIYARWCTETCDNSKVIGDNRYSLMEVWAKDAHAGDIYARVNLQRNGVVIGWTNDTTYLSKGQRGVLTFDSYQYFDQAELTEFNARG